MEEGDDEEFLVVEVNHSDENSLENNIDCLSVLNIKGRNNQQKKSFVQYVLSRNEQEVVHEFCLNNQTSIKHGWKIFHREDEDVSDYRNWLSLDGKYLYCVYCLCFDNRGLSKNISLTKGIDSSQPISRLNQHLKRHEDSRLHNLCKDEFLKVNSTIPQMCHYDERTSRNRNIVKSIIRTIIFNATHGN